MSKRIAMCIVGLVAMLALLVPGCAPAVAYELTVTVDPPGAGTATFEGTGPFAPDDKIPVRATANPGWKFAGWRATAGYFEDPLQPNTNFIMPRQDATITATFGKAVFPTGAMIGELSFTEEKSPTATVTKIAAGTVDLYLQPGIVSADVYRAMIAAGLPYQMSYGAYRDIRYNPVGPTFPGTGKLNPFSVPEIREAMNWLLDREYIVAEHLGGLGAPVWVLGGTEFAELKERYKDIHDAIKRHYAPKSPAEVRTIITPYMTALGATWDAATGKWMHGGAPVEIRVLIRSDLGPFPAAGDYVATQLEKIGFVTARRYVTSPEASPIWYAGDPAAGVWHVYTGGWGIPVIPRDQASTFAGMQTQVWYPVLLFKAYEDQIKTWDDKWPGATESYYDLILRLFRREFSTMAERRAMFERAMWGFMKFGSANVIVDLAGATPYSPNVKLLINKAYGPGEGWTRALHFHAAGEPVWRDRMNIEQETMFPNPWNPVDGSNWVYDLTLKRDAMAEAGLLQDPEDGLYHPCRIKSASVTIGDGLPVVFTGPKPAWLDLTVLPKGQTIPVPDDAWAAWNATTGRWMTAAERFGAGKGTALRKSVVVYPDDIFDFPMHDGSKLSMADFLTALILPLDIAQPASPIYEPARVAAFTAFMAHFRGYRITSVKPLTVEFYSTAWFMDPCWNVATLFPAWKQGGSNPWHMISIGWLASRDRALRFGSAAATADKVTWMDYTKGPSLGILATRLTNAQTPGHADYRFMPYKAAIEAVYDKPEFSAVLGGKIGLQNEIDERYANLKKWYDAKKHFWVDMGLYYLEAVYPVEKNAVMRRFEAHPDPYNRWFHLLKK